MKVIVDFNMAIEGVFEPPIQMELEGSRATVKDLLEHLSNLCPWIEFISGDELGSDIQAVLVNEKEHFSLNTNLNEGDKVKIIIEIPAVAGG